MQLQHTTQLRVLIYADLLPLTQVKYIPAFELRLAVLHHVDVELVGVAVAVAALAALVLGRVHLVLVVQQALCFMQFIVGQLDDNTFNWLYRVIHLVGWNSQNQCQLNLTI